MHIYRRDFRLTLSTAQNQTPHLGLNFVSLVSRRDFSAYVKTDSGRWGEKVDRRNVLEPQGVEFQQMSPLVLEGRRKKKKKTWEGERKKKKKEKKTNTNTPTF